MTKGSPLVWSAPPPKEDNRRIYVMGHPDGGDLAFALGDTLLLDYDSTRIHYRSSTTGGSSGSAVFDDTWQLVGLHHGGSLTMPRLHGEGIYQANEGILMEAIAKACRTQCVGV
jgi:V8-like Glu-specific endopeptidase